MGDMSPKKLGDGQESQLKNNLKQMTRAKTGVGCREGYILNFGLFSNLNIDRIQSEIYAQTCKIIKALKNNSIVSVQYTILPVGLVKNLIGKPYDTALRYLFVEM